MQYVDLSSPYSTYLNVGFQSNLESVPEVPEPGSILLLVTMLAGAVVVAKRRLV